LDFSTAACDGVSGKPGAIQNTSFNVGRTILRFVEHEHGKTMAEGNRRAQAQPQTAPVMRQQRSVTLARELQQIRKTLGPLWEVLPAGALEHNQNAHLESQRDAEHEQPVAFGG